MNKSQQIQKRLFDFCVALVALIVFLPLLLLLIPIAHISTGASGIFRQERIGRFGEPFVVYKLRTMSSVGGSTVTTAKDARITRAGRLLRKSKLDELPQLFNVLLGDMSLVGPRPDVRGYADELVGEEKLILQLRPGITGPASIKYHNEEELLISCVRPELCSRQVIFPDKVQVNLEYIEQWSLVKDIHLLLVTSGLMKIPVELLLTETEKSQIV